jgi:hypothetical protein
MFDSPYVRAPDREIFADALEFSKSKIEKCESLQPGSEASAFFR